MKSYTDIEQSKKLAEFLPIESADYCWGIDEKTLCFNNSPYPCPWKDYTVKQYYVPCWSLAALLDVLPDEADIVKGKVDVGDYKYMCTVCIKEEVITAFGNNLVDTCVDIIIKLHKRKLL